MGVLPGRYSAKAMIGSAIMVAISSGLALPLRCGAVKPSAVSRRRSTSSRAALYSASPMRLSSWSRSNSASWARCVASAASRRFCKN